jgi:hypothetical protein
MVTGTLRVWLRLEGFAVLVLAVTLYARSGSRWWVFAACFLLPDVAFAAYVLGARAGSYAYNVAHSYVLPVLLFAFAVIAARPAWLMPAVLIWLAHIGWDRMLGYGLKSERSFDETHLGPIGKLRRELNAEEQES